ncbi:hypothetical protein D3C83_09270 [compost metagenome]
MAGIIDHAALVHPLVDLCGNGAGLKHEEGGCQSGECVRSVHIGAPLLLIMLAGRFGCCCNNVLQQQGDECRVSSVERQRKFVTETGCWKEAGGASPKKKGGLGRPLVFRVCYQLPITHHLGGMTGSIKYDTLSPPACTVFRAPML